MISVKLNTDKEVLLPIYKKEGAELKENSAAVIAKNGENILGYCIFEIRK